MNENNLWNQTSRIKRLCTQIYDIIVDWAIQIRHAVNCVECNVQLNDNILRWSNVFTTIRLTIIVKMFSFFYKRLWELSWRNWFAEKCPYLSLLQILSVAEGVEFRIQNGQIFVWLPDHQLLFCIRRSFVIVSWI